MNIVQIGSYPISADCIRGGVESSVYGLTLALVRAGHKVDVLDFPRMRSQDAIERHDALTVHRYANCGKHNEDAIRRGDDMMRDIVLIQPDIVHIHGTGKISGALYESVQHNGIPVVLTVHGLIQEEKRQALRRQPSLKHMYQYVVQSRAESKVLNMAHHIIVDTPYVAQMLVAYQKKGKITLLPRMHVIPQGIDSAYFHITCTAESNMILSVGAIAPRKGHLFTLRMFTVLRDKGVNAQLRIIGSLADKQYYTCLVNAIQANPYCADIQLETNVSQKELFAAYHEAKLFVLHSQEESQGIVFAEAMATGLPEVATNVGGIPHVVENGKSGMLCEFGDVQAMAEMTEQLLTDAQLWKNSLFRRNLRLRNTIGIRLQSRSANYIPHHFDKQFV